MQIKCSFVDSVKPKCLDHGTRHYELAQPVMRCSIASEQISRVDLVQDIGERIRFSIRDDNV